MFNRRASRRSFLGYSALTGMSCVAWRAWGQDTLPATPLPVGPTPSIIPNAPAAAPETPAVPDAPPAPPPTPPTSVNLPFPGGPGQRPLVTDFPEKATMILQRSRPPLLETPFETFDDKIFTPNDQFYVNWRWGNFPTKIDPASFRLAVHGNVDRALSLSLSDLVMGLPRVELTAVDQDPGNSRGFFQSRVPGAQWGNGAMGNAKWTGVRLRDVLDRAGVQAGSVQARFRGLERADVPGAPDFMMSLDIDHARDGEVMIAYAMNGRQLPLLNGFPLRLIVPGWYSHYWVQMLSDIEILTQPDDNYWMSAAYLAPDNAGADMMEGAMGVKMAPVTRMNPRSFITNLKPDDKLAPDKPTLVRGIAFGGNMGVARVDVSIDGGKNWKPARLGKDSGRYSFRQFEAQVTIPAGMATLMTRCTNSIGTMQPMTPNWNPAGLMRNVVESISVTVG